MRGTSITSRWSQDSMLFRQSKVLLIFFYKCDVYKLLGADFASYLTESGDIASKRVINKLGIAITPSINQTA